MKYTLMLMVTFCVNVLAQEAAFTNALVSSIIVGPTDSEVRVVRKTYRRSQEDAPQHNYTVAWQLHSTVDIQGLTPVFVLFDIEVTNVAFGRQIDGTYPVVRGQHPAQFPPSPDGASNVIGGLLGYYFRVFQDRFGTPLLTNGFLDIGDDTPYLRGLTNAYFPFRQLQADGFHYGWYQVQRSAPNGYVPWYLVNAAVHPVVDEPIQAGLPPPQPVIEAHVTAAVPPETDPGVRLTWPHAYRNYRLERAVALESPILWEPVDLVGTNQVSLPLGGSNVFYRLSPP
jgi:hypothetical protein